MPRKSDAPRLSDIIMDELADGQPWDLDKHLSGCLAGYQTNPSYGTAVYFALEALSGVAHDVAVRASADVFDPSQRDADWIISPNTKLPIPWIWIRALGVAWDRYKTEREPLGVAFGLEGGGQGKSPGEKEDPDRGSRPGGRREVSEKRSHDQTGLATVQPP